MATSPAGIQFCTQNDVELAIGGQAVLAQLLDKNGDGVADADLVTSVIGRASAEVAAAVGNVVPLANLTSPYPDSLVYHTAQIAAFYAWGQGSSEIVMPDTAKLMHEDSLRFLDQVARRERTFGTATAPASAVQVKQVDPDPNNNRITRAGLLGFI